VHGFYAISPFIVFVVDITPKIVPVMFSTCMPRSATPLPYPVRFTINAAQILARKQTRLDFTAGGSGPTSMVHSRSPRRFHCNIPRSLIRYVADGIKGDGTLSSKEDAFSASNELIS